MKKVEEMTATEKFQQEVMKGLAYYYRQAASESIKRSMTMRSKAGYALQRPPLGYSKTKTSGLFRINKTGKELGQLMKQLANNEISLEIFKLKIFYLLNTNKRGFRTNADLGRLVGNLYYAGKVSWNGGIYNGLHEPLISETEQQKLLEIL